MTSPLKSLSLLLLAAVGLFTTKQPVSAAEFDQLVKPLLATRCIKCHGINKIKGKINLQELATIDQFRSKPEVIQKVIEAIDTRSMPPDEEPQLERAEREKVLPALKTLLAEATAHTVTRLQPRRLNRFQYNNTIRDLFGLTRDIFPLSEKLMTRHSNYLRDNKGVIPELVQVSSDYYLKTGGFEGVPAYPKDLRATHGFDNQANQLTLSPLLLESYIRLSLAIVESPDFNKQTVGIWDRFFAEPLPGTDLTTEVRRRLAPFLLQAFRTPVEPEVIDRYVAYILNKRNLGLTFTESMKKGAAAILCSPRFLFRYESGTPGTDAYDLASRMSFFLWGSAPDESLLQLARSGELIKPEVLKTALDRMLANPKIERFLDSFPAQWMQLENLFAATPDPVRYPQYHLPGADPASVQMVLEPLLLFDTVFVENRPLSDLIKPSFAYRSDFLQSWYRGELAPSKKELEQAVKENRTQEESRARLTKQLAEIDSRRTALIAVVRERVLEQKRKAAPEMVHEKVDLKPYAAWDFNGNTKASISSLDLTAHGKISYVNGSVLLDGGAYLESPKLPISLKAKTLEVWCFLKNPKQQGGGVMTIQGRSSFDSIVYAERKPREWISGSENQTRTQDFVGASIEDERGEPLHLIMVYQEDGTTQLYRNGLAYGQSYKKGVVHFPKDEASVLFGLRHLPAGGNKHLSLLIDRACLYDRALTPAEVVLAAKGKYLAISEAEITASLSPEESALVAELTKSRIATDQSLQALPRRDPKQRFDPEADLRERFNQKLFAQVKSRDFRRLPSDDPHYGGIITTAATLTMTSGPTRTLPIARGSWLIEVILNDPPAPPPNDVPPLDDKEDAEHLTIREKFAQHRKNPTCAGCHSKLDPLGFSLENFDMTGQWRTRYDNNRNVDASGTLLKRYDFTSIVDLKEALLKEERRFAKAFTAHLLRFALARALTPADSLVIDKIIEKTEADHFKMKSILREIIMSEAFLPIKK